VPAAGRNRFAPAGAIALAALLILAHGCATEPGPRQFMGPGGAASREAETRRYDDISEAALLAAGIGVLQDLGFFILASDAQLGVVTGAKQRSSDEVLLDFFRMDLSPAGWFKLPPPDANLGPHDGFRVVLATRNIGGQPRVHDIRVTFYRAWSVRGPSASDQLRHAMVLTSPQIYQQFFGMLSATLARSRADK
jgi:hypothetical protein